MSLPKNFNPAEIEQKWYSYWIDNKFFHSEPNEKEPYTIVIPPPNVTGVLHMGHILNNTIQDVLIRRARMQGKNACWVPGTDHASIATEAKVVNKLKEQGIDKHDIGRDEFMKHAWEWTHEHGGIILKQLRTLGASCDWDRTKFTLDDDLYQSVIKVFIDLYNKGLIYRGIRMVNWDSEAKTAVSDEEVEYKETPGHLYHVRYKLTDSNDFVVIATTRPETILADTAICVNPNDERFKHLHGKKVIVPVINREVPIITDEYVDMEFGTGCLKITPAHDPNDYEIGLKHNLEVIDIFNNNGTLNEKAEFYVGQTLIEARKSILKDIEAAGLLVKIEDYMHKVGYSQRTQVAIEPKISMQWFLKMEDIAKPALENVMNDNIRFFPEMFKNTYRHWMENVRDWNISRQLWWGHQIPAYYIKGTNDFVVAATIEEALKLAKEKTGDKKLTTNDIKQEEDVLDTWFSSWLWPISVFNGINEPENEDIKYYYPTNVLTTGHDIIFFWVARMVISGYEYRGQFPFKDVYFTGMVRDEQKRKMSKQLGNSPDPLDLIAEYGADGVRVGMLLCSPAGGDLLYKSELVEQGRNFANKIWNAARLVTSWNVEDIEQPKSSKVAIDWFNAKINQALENIDNQYDTYRLSEALMTIYRLFWDDFASWYLEIIKPAFGKPMDSKTFEDTKEILDKMLRVLHPFMPFVTEEIWQNLSERKEGETIVFAEMPVAQKYDEEFINKFENIKSIISNIRKIRLEKQIKFADKIKVSYNLIEGEYDNFFDEIVIKSCNLEAFENTSEKIQGAISFIVKNVEYYIPLTDNINVEEEIEKLQKELEYNLGFLKGVQKKLSNERFVNNAPAKVIEIEKQKQTDAENKIKALEEQIANLKG
ncbi:MAG: valine--tRNA ligase [Bacteroidales bacterium]|nr:valine--tRNA ligase [Bacteroidales bacterium]